MPDLRRRFDVAGAVQGVGFRPFIHRAATDLALSGFVRNVTNGVTIELEGPREQIESFALRLLDCSPPAARVTRTETTDIACDGHRGFSIEASAPQCGTGPPPTVPPDRTTCDECLAELDDPGNRRFRHPFITCSGCGPRFTVITRLPFDRPNTTMSRFTMCARCAAEYTDPSDRRHHAQTLSCPDCGPALTYSRPGDIRHGTDDVIAETQRDLAEGKIVAVKGIGGYHLAVDATDDAAVRRLRDRKGRPDKPLAVMVRDLDAARRLADIGELEAAALCSPERPIVVLTGRKGADLAPSVAPGSPLVGAMLAYSPLHHLLFRETPGGPASVPTVLVMTSGNVAGEPILARDDDARRGLSALADTFCRHDRPIHVPCDDGVVRLVDDKALPLRLGRGMAPRPIPLPFAVPDTLAFGGDIKNAVCVAASDGAVMSQHLGDTASPATTDALDTAIDALWGGGMRAEVVVTDAHPGYRTRRLGRDRSGTEPSVEISHHHAHLASLMADNGLDGRQPVVGVVFDGSGYGPDGHYWGGEVLIGDYASIERRAHLAEVPLPGGDSAVRRPYRMALAHLRAAGVEWADDLAPVARCTDPERRVLDSQLESGAGCATTTSMGRLFDTVASILDVRHEITYEAQAAIELEALAGTARHHPSIDGFGVSPEGVIDPAPLLRSLVGSLRAGVDRSDLAAGFHDAVVDVIELLALDIREERSIEVVGLTGGAFQNARLLGAASARLASRGVTVLRHRHVPPNDGGLALGQVMIAAAQGMSASTPSSEVAACA